MTLTEARLRTVKPHPRAYRSWIPTAFFADHAERRQALALSVSPRRKGGRAPAPGVYPKVGLQAARRLRDAAQERLDYGVEPEQALWRIPAERMKMDDPHHVPLSRQASDALAELYKLAGKSRFLFPSRAKGPSINK